MGRYKKKEDSFDDIGEIEFLDEGTTVGKQMNFTWILTRHVDRIMQCDNQEMEIKLINKYRNLLSAYLDKKYKKEIFELHIKMDSITNKMTPQDLELKMFDLKYEYAMQKFRILMQLARRKNLTPMEQITSHEG